MQVNPFKYFLFIRFYRDVRIFVYVYVFSLKYTEKTQCHLSKSICCRRMTWLVRSTTHPLSRHSSCLDTTIHTISSWQNIQWYSQGYTQIYIIWISDTVSESVLIERSDWNSGANRERNKTFVGNTILERHCVLAHCISEFVPVYAYAGACVFGLKCCACCELMHQAGLEYWWNAVVSRHIFCSYRFFSQQNWPCE